MKNTKNIGSEKWKILLKLQEKFIVKLGLQKNDMTLKDTHIYKKI